MKKILFLLFICYFLYGCSSTSIKSIQPNNEPSIQNIEYFQTPVALDTENELEYNNIYIKLDKETYSLGEDVLKCRITNANIGKGFYYYYIPLVEYFDGNDWIRLSYYPPETQYEEQWYFCAIDGNHSKENSTIISMYPKYLREQLIAGKYRLLIFVGPNKYYAEFNLK